LGEDIRHRPMDRVAGRVDAVPDHPDAQAYPESPRSGLEIAAYMLSVPRELWLRTKKRRANANAHKAGSSMKKTRSTMDNAHDPAGTSAPILIHWYNSQAMSDTVSQKTLRVTGAVALTWLVPAINGSSIPYSRW
jgi:hypothetical protein